MRDELDLSSYAAARWATAVRVVVLLGRPPEHAAVLAREALARLDDQRPDAAVDLDVALARTLLDVVRDDRTPWWERPEPDDAEAPAGLAELEPALDALTPAARARLVLAGVARLEPDQVDDVVAADRDDDADAPDAEAVGLVADAVAVPPYASVSGVAAVERRRARRRWRRAGVAIGVVAVLALVLVVVRAFQGATGLPAATPTSPTTAPSPVPSPSTAPPVTLEPPRTDGVPVPWYVPGRLTLPGGRVTVADVTALAQVSDRLVLATLDDRRLVLAPAYGTLIALGRVRPGDRFVTDPDERIAAWIDRHERSAEAGGQLIDTLMVRDLDTGTDIGGEVVTTDTRVVAIDDGLVYVADAGGYSIVRTNTSLQERHDGVDLLDVASGVRATAPRAGRVRIQAPGAAPTDLPGVGAQVSDDGRYALVESPPGSRRAAFIVVDVALGTTTELPRREQGRSVAAAFAPDGRVVFVIARPPTTYDLISCDLVPVTCRLDVRLSDLTAAPLLAN